MAEDRPDSLDKYLGSLSSEELARIARQLAELQRQPGWVVLTDLVEIQKNKLVQQLIGRPMQERMAAHVGGTAKGLEQFQQITAKVLAANRTVQELLSREPGRA